MRWAHQSFKGIYVSDAFRVVVAIPTFRREADLDRLLRSLPACIDDTERRYPSATLDVLIVDNDAAQSARWVETPSEGRVPVRYVCEPSSGLASVRNRALDESQGADILVFIDDDETPADPGWLSKLLDSKVTFKADVVAGPVRTVVDGVLDPWIVAGGFYARAHRTHLATGEPIARAATNNLLLDRHFVSRHSLRFDARFGHTGGEDSLFTAAACSAGARMIWNAEALVLDHLLPERQTRAHALARSRGIAAAGVSVARVLAGPSRFAVGLVNVRATARALVHFVAGAVNLACGRLAGSEKLDAKGHREWAHGRGGLDGIFGRKRAVYGTGVEAAPVARRDASK